MINNQFLSQKLFTRYTLRIDRTSSEIVARSNEPTFVRVPFFFFLFFFIFEAQTRNLAVLSERDSRKIARFLSIVICKRILCPFLHCRDIRQRNFALLLRDNVWYIHDTVLQLSIYNDRRNVKNCSSMRSKIENFSKKFYSFHECENILFFSAKSKVFVKNAKRIFYSNIQCPFSLFDFCLSV